MKKVILLLLLFAATRLYADDTAQLQAMINSGNTTLPAKHAPYTITSLHLVHSLNANGNIFHCISPVGAAIKINSPGIKFSNVELVGLDDSNNTSGSSGVEADGDNDTVTNIYIHRFTAYGIIGGDGNRPVIINNKIIDVGYIGVFFVSGKHDIKGGIVAGNIIDRSMLDPATVVEGALKLRGSAKYVSTGWQVYRNRLIMPVSQKDINAECFELRRAPHSNIHDNICIGSSIALSIVRSAFVHTYHNICTMQSEEAIEYADSDNGMIKDNTISHQLGMGLLIDGFPPFGCHFDTLSSNHIAGGKDIGVQLFKETHNIYIKDCVISADSKVINIQGADHITLDNCQLRGGGKTVALFLDNSSGKVTMRGGSIKGAGYKFFIYGTKQLVTDGILLDGVKAPEGVADYDKALSGGASLGSNIRVK